MYTKLDTAVVLDIECVTVLGHLGMYSPFICNFKTKVPVCHLKKKLLSKYLISDI